MVEKVIILFFIFINTIKSQVIYDNSFNGYFLTGEYLLSSNQLYNVVQEPQYEHGMNLGDLIIIRSKRLSSGFYLGLSGFQHKSFGWSIGYMYDEASLAYHYRQVSRKEDFGYTTLPIPYPSVYERSIKESFGYLIRNMQGIKAGFMIRTSLFDIKINSAFCKYVTYHHMVYSKEQIFTVVGSGVNYSTSTAQGFSGGTVQIFIPDDSIVTLKKESIVENDIRELKKDPVNPHLPVFLNRFINSPSFFDIPFEVAAEKTILIRPFLFTIGLRASISNILPALVLNSGYYTGYGAYLGVGFGKVTTKKKTKKGPLE